MKTQCANTIAAEQHAKDLDADEHFSDWLCDYQTTNGDIYSVIETLIDNDDLVTIFNAVQFIFENGLETGQLAEVKALIDADPSEQLHYIAAYVDTLDIDELANIVNGAYGAKGYDKDCLLNGIDDAVTHYLDNEPAIYQKYQDDMEARYNEEP